MGDKCLTKNLSIMKKMNIQMNCPNCGNNIKLDQLLVKEFEQSIRENLEAELSLRESELNQKREEFKILQQQLSKEKEDVDEIVSERVKSLLHSKEEALKESIRKEVSDERANQLQQLEDELIKKSAQLKEYHGTKAQLERLRREMEEAETRIILEKEKELTERLEQARMTIKEQVQQEHFFKLKEREQIIESLKLKLDEAKRKAEQGSMQGQGEVLELYLENLLRNTFPTDEIIEVKKGELGADCIQKVRTASGVEIGTIVWEAKNTKAFSNSWIDKIKQDGLKSNADVLIIVSSVMPSDLKGKFAIKDGVWICQRDSIVDLCLALRFGMLKIQSALITQENRESKKDLLFDYLTSENFKNMFESILDSFKKIQDSYQQEKLRTQRLWKEREKQLELALANTIEFYGTIKGISSSVPEVQSLDIRPAA